LPDVFADSSRDSLAEQAIEDLRIIYRDFLAAQRARNRTSQGRMPGEAGFAEDRSSQLAIASLVATIEHYSLDVLEVHTGKRPRSWHKQAELWLSELGVQLAARCPNYPALRGFVEARNAVMHGQGSLTDQQVKESAERWAQIKAFMKAAGLERMRRLLILTPETVARCTDVCTAVVGELETCRPQP
jgi:hypothetical protein